MNLVNRHRLALVAALLTLLNPLLVFPYIRVEVGNDRSGLGTHLLSIAERVGLIYAEAVNCLNLEFIHLVLGDTGNEDFVYAYLAYLTHHMDSGIPVVEVTYNGNSLSVGSPYVEENALNAVNSLFMSAELVVKIVVGSLTEQVAVNLAELNREVVTVLILVVITFLVPCAVVIVEYSVGMHIRRENTFFVHKESAMNFASVLIYKFNGVTLRKINRNPESVFCKVRA